MFMTKAKMTGFTKFLILMIIVGPLAFLGASYYRGEDGVAAIKSLFSNSATTTSPNTQEIDNNIEKRIDNTDNVLLESQLNKYKDELEQKNRVIDTLYLENARLKSELNAKTKQMEQSKTQLEKVKSVLN